MAGCFHKTQSLDYRLLNYDTVCFANKHKCLSVCIINLEASLET